jgi:hypothetical protein
MWGDMEWAAKKHHSQLCLQSSALLPKHTTLPLAGALDCPAHCQQPTLCIATDAAGLPQWLHQPHVRSTVTTGSSQVQPLNISQQGSRRHRGSESACHNSCACSVLLQQGCKAHPGVGVYT